MMRTRSARLVLALAALFAAEAPSSRAQMRVIDPTNLAQNIVQAARALEQINNQIRQIELETRMLAPSGVDVSDELMATIGEARALLAEAQGLSFEASRIGDELAALYPETYAEFHLEEALARSDRWLEQSRLSLELAMAAEARAAGSLDRSRETIALALDASRQAQGQTGAVQAGNQLLAATASELAELRGLIAAQGRALEAERMERLARESRAGEIRRRAFPARRPARGDEAPPARTAF